MNVFVFDIETVPDTENGRLLYELGDLDDADTCKAMQHIRVQETGGSDFMRLHMQKIVAISAVLRQGRRLKVWSLGNADSSERELVQRFFQGVEKYSPTLVSWNGSGFDLPVLHYRALLHKVDASRYWETGDEDTSFRYNNYLSRYHWRHIDVMDVLAGFQPRAGAKLDQIASMLGFPGKMGMSGAKVMDQWLAGDVKSIRDYCETDVLNTFLVYLRFELMRGRIDWKEYLQECDKVREVLVKENKPHFTEFLDAWPE